MLQHNRERTHPLNTARITELGLTRCRLIPWFEDRSMARSLQLTPGTGVLYPAPDALPLESLPAEARPPALLLIDGTWHQAHRMLRDIPELAGLQAYSLSPPPSGYRIRREPRLECVSTVESAVHALRCLEPGLAGLDQLLGAFDRMIDDQLSTGRRPGTAEPRRRNRSRSAWFSLPPELRTRGDAATVFYAEGIAPERRSGTVSDPFYVVAQRLADGASFATFVETRRVPDAHHLALLGLSEAETYPRLARSELTSWRREVAGPESLGVAWNRSTIDMLEAATGLGLEWVFLKQAADSFQRRLNEPVARSLDQLVQQLALAVEPSPLPGRAATRLAQAAAVCRWMLAAVPEEGR